MTSPQPITSGGLTLDLSAADIDSVDGIALSTAARFGGAAVINSRQVNVQFTSPNASLGVADCPLLTLAVRISPNALPGQSFPVTLNPAGSWWRDPSGFPIPIEVKPGSITVGGSVSIMDVVPGGGALPAGAAFSILGLGFSAQTRLQLSGLSVSALRLVSPAEIQVTLEKAGLLDGTRIQAVNPDNSSSTYYSYMRGVPMGQSTRTLLARTEPIFSPATALEATLPVNPPQVNASYFTAIALQNRNAGPVDLTIESRSAAGALIAGTQVILPPHHRFTREVSELLGAALPVGAYVHVVSTQPVQILGLVGNDRDGTVVPVIPVTLNTSPYVPAESAQ